MQIKNIGESLHWSYANLAMAHAAVVKGSIAYGRSHYIIRSRLYKGLRDGGMSMGGIADDERMKLVLPQACCYCGSRKHLAVDHLIARKRGGADAGENMVWSCRSCNSSKCANDALEWLDGRGEFPPLLLLRRYLKLAVEYCSERNLMDAAIAQASGLPFALAAIPHHFPAPCKLTLWRVPLDEVIVQCSESAI